MPDISRTLLRIGVAVNHEEFSAAVLEFFRETVVFNAAEVRLRIFDRKRDKAEHVDSLFPTKRTRTPEEMALRKRLAPIFGFVERNPATTVYRGQQQTLPPLPLLERMQFFKEFMVPEGWHDNIGMSFYDKSGPHSWIFLNRSFAQPAFSDAEVGLFHQIYPYFDGALQRIKTLADSQATRANLENSLLDLPIATLILDWKLNIQHANRAARRLCQAWAQGTDRSLLKAYGRLEVPADLRNACRELGELWLSTAVSKKCEIRRVMEHPNAIGLQASINMLRPNSVRLGAPSFLIRLTEVRPAERPELTGLAQQILARLSPAEREVAAMAAKGETNRMIAQRLGKSTMTVKNQVHTILEKVGAANRTQFAAMLH